MQKVRKIKFFILAESQNYTFTSKPLSKPTDHASPPVFESLVKDYIQDINKNSTDFKNEFGFVETLNEIRLEKQKSDKIFSYYFSSVWALICTGGIFLLLLNFQRDLSAKRMKTFGAYICSSRLILYGFINTNRAMLWKILAIDNYLNKMESFHQTNSIYYARLLTELVNILSRVKAFHQGSKEKKCKSFEEITEKTPGIIKIIYSVLSLERNKEYHEKLVKSLTVISQCLRKVNRLLDLEISLFLMKSSDLNAQSEGVVLLNSHLKETKTIKDFTLIEVIFKKMEENLKNWQEKAKNCKEDENFEQLLNQFNINLININLSLLSILLKSNLKV